MGVALKDPAQVVRTFVEAWARLDAAELAAFFTEDGVYHNMPIQPVAGRDNVRRFIEAFLKSWTATQWDIITLMASGDTVMVERVDRTKTAGGGVDLPCVGVFTIRDGKIAVWRDYFDMSTYRNGLAKAVQP